MEPWLRTLSIEQVVNRKLLFVCPVFRDVRKRLHIWSHRTFFSVSLELKEAITKINSFEALCSQEENETNA